MSKISSYPVTTELLDADKLDVSSNLATTPVSNAITVGDFKRMTGGFVLVKTVGFAELSTGGLTNNVLGYSLPAGYEIRAVWRRVTTAFVGCATLLCEFGITGDENKHGTNLDCTSTGKKRSSNTQIENEGSATSINAYFTATVNNLDQLSAGEMEIYVEAVKVF